MSFWVPSDKLPKNVTKDDLANLRAAEFWVHGSGVVGLCDGAWKAITSCLVPCALPPKPSEVLGQ